MTTVQFGCFSLVNDCQRSAAAGGNLNIGTCKATSFPGSLILTPGTLGTRLVAKMEKSEFTSFRTFFQENESTSAINKTFR